MADQEQLDLLKQGVEVWNQWRQKNPRVYLDLRYADLRDVDLHSADLVGANLGSADLRGVDLSFADLSEGLFWDDPDDPNSGCGSLRTNLEKANLFGANLFGANLEQAYLSYADLHEADFTSAYLGNTDLRHANLHGAKLWYVSFRHAELNLTDLSGSDLHQAEFIRTDLNRVNFRRARLFWTTFVDVDLREATGLETVVHEGPSHIGIETIYRSHGQIPESFLRKAGVPESFLTNMRALVESMSPIDFYSCFISYSSKDHAFAKRLYADLQSSGVRCWFAPEDMKIGDKIRPRIDESIRVYDKLLLVLSQYSVTSQWVEQEVETAFAKERKEKRVVLFPIRLDKTVMDIEEGWSALIRNTRNIGDFTSWKRHDAYQKALERLLRDLKAETSKPEA